MLYVKRLKTLITAIALLFGTGMVSPALAADLSDPGQVVEDYLGSLTSGDIEGILARIDGKMKSKNRALELSPETYSTFLQDHYAGVQTTLEELVPESDKIRARVRFDYPASDSSMIVFILTETDGQWKISNEDD